MSEATQLELANLAKHYSEQDMRAFRDQLRANGWQTRRQLCQALGWEERKVRSIAEALGDEIVRGQAGFKLVSMIERDELGKAVQARDQAIAQGKRMIRYGYRLGRKIRELMGG